MSQKKRISQIVFIVVLCLFIFYAGCRLKFYKAGDWMPEVNSFLLRKTEQTYLAGFSFLSEGGALPGQWLTESAVCMFPLGMYVSSSEPIDLDVQDTDTYEMILEKQAKDENEVDENGNLVKTDETKSQVETEKQEVSTPDISEKKLEDFDYLLSTFYTVDGSTKVTEKDLDAKKLLAENLKLDQKTGGSKILIYHTHSQEDFKDSEKGDKNTTIMGMGARLAKVLNEKYGIETMHHEGVYDLIDGKLDRSKAYQLAEEKISEILKQNPSIEVVIDLHRDGVSNSTHLVTEIDGRPTAQIMFFNGMSRTKANGEIEYLKNPYISDNLAFSLQMQLAAAKLHPGFTRRIYLKSYRYNMHLKPKTLLVEAGAQTNTVEEMRNAMDVLAEILNECLT